MSHNSQYVIPHEGSWAVRDGANAGHLRRFERKEDAIRYARALALQLGGDMIIHRQDGTVQTRDSYAYIPAEQAG